MNYAMTVFEANRKASNATDAECIGALQDIQLTLEAQGPGIAGEYLMKLNAERESYQARQQALRANRKAALPSPLQTLATELQLGLVEACTALHANAVAAFGGDEHDADKFAEVWRDEEPAEYARWRRLSTLAARAKVKLS